MIFDSVYGSLIISSIIYVHELLLRHNLLCMYVHTCRHTRLLLNQITYDIYLKTIVSEEALGIYEITALSKSVSSSNLIGELTGRDT